jgi:regulator of cell morphogenesis and NO signaling
MKIHENATVGEIAALMPEALPVFQEMGIDYCCGGKRPLKEALDEKRTSIDQFESLVSAREAGRKANAGRTDFTAMSPAVLSAYIEDTHHEYLRKALPEIGAVLMRVLRAHGANHRELYDAYVLYGRLRSDLEQHLIKEETLLFPALTRGGEEAGEAARLAGEIVSEHEAAGELLRALREVTSDYAVPDDACPTYQKAYRLLPELERDLHQHIHLENNILLKGATA